MADEHAGLEATLGGAYSPVDYMSITSFPRLPEDDAVSGEHALKSRKDEDHVLGEQDTGNAREPTFSITERERVSDAYGPTTHSTK
ncbi:hypothetical protein P4O66_004531 [Electrophorus voltai]|uniref:Uncharacterized protein n=1 Tax=Electrophorus voltai TaxID=2609070 RepID=A0AAD9E444_9TELE|nr:hypothetical protein P4O66_004531 [Electrophorus voltai]